MITPATPQFTSGGVPSPRELEKAIRRSSFAGLGTTSGSGEETALAGGGGGIMSWLSPLIGQWSQIGGDVLMGQQGQGYYRSNPDGTVIYVQPQGSTVPIYGRQDIGVQYPPGVKAGPVSQATTSELFPILLFGGAAVVVLMLLLKRGD